MSVRLTTIRVRKRWVVLALLVLIAGGSTIYGRLTATSPDSAATLIAGPIQPELKGTVMFRNVAGGALVTVEVAGLPPYRPGTPPGTSPVGPHGFHVHEGSSCEVGDPANPFQAAGGHWNPDGQPHGNHAGDFPVLFSNAGKARMTFFTDRFSADDVVGRTVIIHQNPDDYRTQPAGDSGLRMACGIIVRYAR